MVGLLSASLLAPAQVGLVAPSTTGPTIHPTASGAVASASPLYFEPNLGQFPDGVRFAARGGADTVLLRDDGFLIVQRESRSPTEVGRAGAEVAQTEAAPPRGHVVAVRFLAGAAEGMRGLDAKPGVSHYLLGGDADAWLHDVPHHARVAYADVWPGIDVVFYGTPAGEVEFDFIVAPGAHPGRIGLAFEGHDALHVSDAGELRLTTALGEARLRAPFAYQDIAGARVEVEAAYTTTGHAEVGFSVGLHDAALPLVIDPVVVYASLLDGSADDIVGPLDTDPLGFLYASGVTQSNDFPEPILPGPTQFQGDWDAFLTVLDPAGVAFLSTTYIGGSQAETVNGLQLGGAAVGSLGLGVGTAYLAGTTTSSDFPTTLAAAQPVHGGVGDGWVMHLDLGGMVPFYSTYLGGPGHEALTALTLDALGSVVVTGRVLHPGFPATPGAHQVGFGGGFSDIFVAKLDPLGATWEFATHIGGAPQEAATDVAVEADGEIVVAGFSTRTRGCGACPWRYSPEVNPMQSYGGGIWDVYLAKLSADGSALQWASYLGGSSSDQAGGGAFGGSSSVSVDAVGTLIVCGRTTSTDFPVTADALQPAHAGGASDLFFARIDSAGPSVLYSTYLGGPDLDQGFCSYDAGADAIVFNAHSRGGFPVVDSLHPSGQQVAGMLNADATEVTFATYWPGTSLGVSSTPLSYSETFAGFATDALGGLYFGVRAGPATPLAAQCTPADGLRGGVVKVIVPIDAPDPWNLVPGCARD